MRPSQPAADEDEVAVAASLTAVFSKPVDPTTVTDTSFVVLAGGVSVVGSIAVDGATATFSPVSPFVLGTTVTATITTAVTDIQGSPLAADFDWTFAVMLGTATQLQFDIQPSDVTADDRFTVSVSYRDDLGAIVGNESASIALTIFDNPVNALLEDADGNAVSILPQSPLNGVATFVGVAIRKTAIGYTLAADGSSWHRISNPFDVTSGAAAALAFDQQPSPPVGTNIVAGGLIEASVNVLDAHGNYAADAVDSISLTMTTPATGVVLLGTTTHGAIGGQAYFDDLAIQTSGTNFVISATAAGLAPSSSLPFNVVPGPVAQLAFTLEPPTSATADDQFTVAVSYQDTYGNVVLNETNEVVLSLVYQSDHTPAGDLWDPDTMMNRLTLEQPPTMGTASFANIAVRSADNALALRAVSAGNPTLPSTISQAFDVTAGAFVRVSFTDHPTDIPGEIVDAATVFDVLVQAEDSWGNPISGVTDVVTLSLCEPGPGVPSVCNAPTNGAVLEGTLTHSLEFATGSVYADDLHVDMSSPPGSAYKVRASVAGITPGLSDSFQIVASYCMTGEAYCADGRPIETLLITTPTGTGQTITTAMGLFCLDLTQSGIYMFDTPPDAWPLNIGAPIDESIAIPGSHSPGSCAQSSSGVCFGASGPFVFLCEPET